MELIILHCGKRMRSPVSADRDKVVSLRSVVPLHESCGIDSVSVFVEFWHGISFECGSKAVYHPCYLIAIVF